jgi:hypothetical protein
MDMKSNSSMSMQMYFYASDSATILFKSWMTSTWQQMLGSCIAVLVAAILYEGLKVLRAFLQNRIQNKVQEGHYRSSQESFSPSMEDNILAPSPPRHQMSRRTAIILHHILQSFLYLIQVALGYLLMLVSMTFNVWLFISIIIGAGLGYFFFNLSNILKVDTNELCH